MTSRSFTKFEWNGHPIKTNYWNNLPPDFDHVARVDGDEEFGHNGYGPSRDIAIADLIQTLWERGD